MTQLPFKYKEALYQYWVYMAAYACNLSPGEVEA